jgi:hypothetical protein
MKYKWLLEKIIEYYDSHRMPDYGDGPSELLHFLLASNEEKEE